MRSFLPLVVLGLSGGCSPSTAPGDGGAGGGGGGTAERCTFSGGKTDSVSCAFTRATWAQSSNRTTIQIDSAMGATTTVSAQFVIASTPGTSTYSAGIGDTECTIDVTEGVRHWGASTLMSLGACSLSLRTVREVTNAMGMRTYELHGGFTASTEPDDGMGGTVTVMSSF